MTSCYFETGNCTHNMWQCLTCKEWFCSYHWHTTDLGDCVECAACAYIRLQEVAPETEMKTVDFTGTVVQATMQAQDLLLAFMDVLWKYHPEAYILATEGMFEAFDLSYTELCGHPFHMAWQSPEMSDLLYETLWDAMDEIAPESYYFGAHEGDGCDYGFWKIKDWVKDQCCHFCGRCDLTLLTCPKCDELLCQDCLDEDKHVCKLG